MMEPTKTMTDNFREVAHAVYRAVLDEAPLGLGEYERSLLAAAVLSSEPDPGRLYLEFRRPIPGANERSCANLTVIIEGGDTEQDAEGNLLRRYELKLETSWGSQGSASPELQRFRIWLLTELNDFAASLLRRFPDPFWKLEKTAAEMSVVEQRRAKLAANNRVSAAVERECKNMRVTSDARFVVMRFGTDISTMDARLEVQVGNKVFVARPAKSCIPSESACNAFWFDRIK